MMSAKTFSLDIRKDGIGILTMDVPGESMNTLKAAFADEIRTVLADPASAASKREFKTLLF